MKVYIKRKNGIDATAEFDTETKEIIVKKGSVLSDTISYTEKFRGAKSIENKRKGVVEGNILKKDVLFRSASTAANFVTGSSTNGLLAWRDISGKCIKDIISAIEE